ncbi:MAG TPA: hypothetical protein VFR70_08490 [Flavobacterium sp.]|nr:hypothetical protein [Flavobacterium sp.]
MKNIFWKGYSNEERHLAIDKVQNIVSSYGSIIGFKLFSDISLTVVIEIEESEIDRLYGLLSDNLKMDRHEYLNSDSSRERTLYLNITFAIGTGDRRNEVSSVPG